MYVWCVYIYICLLDIPYDLQHYQHSTQDLTFDKSNSITWHVVFHLCVLGNSLPRIFPGLGTVGCSHVDVGCCRQELALKLFCGNSQVFCCHLHPLVDKEFEMLVIFSVFSKKERPLDNSESSWGFNLGGAISSTDCIKFSIGYCWGHHTNPNNALLWANHPKLPYKLAVFDSPNMGNSCNLVTLVITFNSSFGKV